MVTKYSHPIVSSVRFTSTGQGTQPEEEGLGGRALDRIRQVFCGLHGHDSLLQFEQDRMFLKCVSCGHESPGWELNETPPTVSVRGDARLHALRHQPNSVQLRRIA